MMIHLYPPLMAVFDGVFVDFDSVGGYHKSLKGLGFGHCCLLFDNEVNRSKRGLIGFAILLKGWTSSFITQSD
ncbi:hypothetical protein Ccrd_025545 [Cynara cardunculus var. scolymus]|uniref:Uncharacterized protein n=1 Tax=Cynara cardunculus var. scolymus TaxID=59895 RepID=A0A103WNQ5_CYNCS|nr:hypothetical protein Ccrd_025545 [Cynara cardunculus var. scolymus]